MTTEQDLATRVDELAATIAGLTRDVEDLMAAFTANLDHADEASPATPAYSTLEDWVDGFFLPTFRRQFGGELRWCNRWPDHPEACLRLEALWRSWEALRLDPTLGIATWLTSYLDPQFAALLSRSGTFATCTPERHTPL
jgi:hypothetical protein